MYSCPEGKGSTGPKGSIGKKVKYIWGKNWKKKTKEQLFPFMQWENEWKKTYWGKVRWDTKQNMKMKEDIKGEIEKKLQSYLHVKKKEKKKKHQMGKTQKV